MKKFLLILIIAIVFASCSNYESGELVGVARKGSYFEPTPYGMILVPMGSYVMGPNDEDISKSLNAKSKTISVEAFWMDETEITNNEYRQFVYYVRDSIIRRKLGEIQEDFLITEDDNGNPIDPPIINWETEIDYENEEIREALKELYLSKEERFYGRNEFDSRLLNYEYFWIDIKQASNPKNRYNFNTKKYEGEVTNLEGNKVPINDRSAFIMRDVINVYPDTLCWAADFAYSFNEPMVTMYFWHPAYDNYPVVGVNWRQARAFAIWRSQYLNNYLASRGEPFVHDYRLPFEAEWEYAARGNLALMKYPWGGPYTRNYLGCFLANFKPLRGNYIDDGAFYTIKVASYEPNDYGLYDMAGNVAEWTADSFDESAYSFEHDMNPYNTYEARPDDPPALKRKVVRGGSWKDVGYFIQVGTRTYEYQDTATSFIGFRCVRTYLGNSD
jgi:formylglycine-generating enzyme required for sulfatase activity